MIKLNRKKTRKLLFQKIYAMSFWDFNNDLFDESFYEGVFDFDMDKVYYTEMSDIIIRNEKFFIQILEKYAPKFKISQMNTMYVLPVYIGLAEIFYLTEEIPIKVSMNESIEIAKAFWDDSAKKIVNWVLNNVYKNYDELKELSKNPTENTDFSIFKKTS